MNFQIPKLKSQTRRSGFTMIEIALCLAIIGFALVAIIGVLPTGLNVQKDNREETIIDQDAALWMDAIRNGTRGYDDLTNYVISITNYVWHYTWNPAANAYKIDDQVGRTGSPVPYPEIDVFTRTEWDRGGRGGPIARQPSDPQFLLTNGLHIVGILSRPKVEWDPQPKRPPFYAFYRNYIIANVRAISGSAVEKFPQANPTVLGGAFSYRMIPENDPYVPFSTNLIYFALPVFSSPFDPSNPDQFVSGGTNGFDPSLPDLRGLTNRQPPVRIGMSAAQMAAYREAYWDQVRANRLIMGLAYTNSHDLRLTFRWPLQPNGDAGVGRHTFRLLTGGEALATNDPSPGVLQIPLYFFQPSTYVRQ